MKIEIKETENLYTFYRFNGHGKPVFVTSYNKRKFTLEDCKRMFTKQHHEKLHEYDNKTGH